MRASADLVVGMTMLALFAAGTVVIIAAEAAVWTLVGWLGKEPVRTDAREAGNEDHQGTA